MAKYFPIGKKCIAYRFPQCRETLHIALKFFHVLPHALLFKLHDIDHIAKLLIYSVIFKNM